MGESRRVAGLGAWGSAIFRHAQGEEMTQEERDMLRPVEYLKAEGGFLVPQKLPVPIPEHGLRKVLVWLRLAKPRYEWVDTIEMLRSVAGQSDGG